MKIFVFLFSMLLFCFSAAAAEVGPTTVSFTATDAKAEKMARIDSVNAANPEAAAAHKAAFDSIAAANLETVADEPTPDPSLLGSLWASLKALVADNWGKILLFLLGAIAAYVAATPTTRDDAIFGWIRRILESLIPPLRRKK
jgi:hypothetical protein